jgi:hypothetical protein
MDELQINKRLSTIFQDVFDEDDIQVVDPEKVIFRQIEFEYCGLSGLPG